MHDLRASLNELLKKIEKMELGWKILACDVNNIGIRAVLLIKKN